MRKLNLPVGLAVCGLLAAALLMARPIVQAQGAIILNPAQVVGPSVTLTWSASGATNYVLKAGVASQNYVAAINLGNVSTFSIGAPAAGTYFARVEGNNGSVSNEISFAVTSMSVPPPAPTNLATYLNGTTAVISWDPGVGGGSTAGYVLHAGTAPGLANLGQFPFPASTTSLAVPVGPGTYYLRVFGVNQGGPSAASNDATLVMPAGGGCTAPPARSINQMIFGQYVRLSWAGVPGASGYLFNFNGTYSGSQFVPGHVNSLTVSGAPLGVYQATLTTAFSCGQSSVGPLTTITVDGAPPPGQRSPNPPPGQLLPFRNDGGVVEQLARERPDLLHASCREHGGNNRFMFEVVRRLRAIDNRYGLNWKRGNWGDLSQDIVTYNASAKSDEGARSPDIYIVDIIGGHCGSNPSAAWINQTQATRDAGSIGIWTLLPYLDAGNPLAGDLTPQ